MRLFNHQIVDGALFGASSPVILPRFQQVRASLSPDGQVQLDAVGQTDEGEKWVIEVKWRNKRAGVKELEKLAQRAKFELAQGWFVARAGFTDEARQFAAQNKLYCSDKAAIDTLQTVVK